MKDFTHVKKYRMGTNFVMKTKELFLFFLISACMSGCVHVSSNGQRGLDKNPTYRIDNQSKTPLTKVLSSSSGVGESWNEETGVYSNDEYGFSWRLKKIGGKHWRRINQESGKSVGKGLFAAYNPYPSPEGIAVGVVVWPNNLEGDTDAWKFMELGLSEKYSNMEKITLYGHHALKYWSVEKLNDGREVKLFGYLYLTEENMFVFSVAMPEKTYKKLEQEKTGYSPEELARVICDGYSINDVNLGQFLKANNGDLGTYYKIQ